MGQERIQKEVRHTRDETVQENVDTTPAVENGVDLEAIDALLDQIDLVLEENPVEFVEQYQQRGGQ